MNLINKEHIVITEVGEYCCQISGLSIAGPDVILILTPNSEAIMLANVVFPNLEGHTAAHGQGLLFSVSLLL